MHIDQLVADKKYFVPIRPAGRRKGRHLSLVLLLLLVMAAAAGYAWQTGLIKR